MSEKKHLLLTVQIQRDGELQRRIVSLERYCSMQEVVTALGLRTLIKFVPDSMMGSREDMDCERPIYALESIEEIVAALGDEIALPQKPKAKRRARKTSDA